jgi:hypothetical protein
LQSEGDEREQREYPGHRFSIMSRMSHLIANRSGRTYDPQVVKTFLQLDPGQIPGAQPAAGHVLRPAAQQAAPRDLHVRNSSWRLAAWSAGTSDSGRLGERIRLFRARLIPLHEMGVQPAGDEIRLTEDLEV